MSTGKESSGEKRARTEEGCRWARIGSGDDVEVEDAVGVGVDVGVDVEGAAAVGLVIV